MTQLVSNIGVRPAGAGAASTPARRRMMRMGHGARVYQFSSREDASLAPGPAACAGAPFAPTASLGAVLLPSANDTVDGEVTDGAPIGTATACLRFTNPDAPVGHAGRLFVAFNLPEGRVTAEGTIGVLSHDVAARGAMLAACSLRVISAPKGIRGGTAEGMGVFGPDASGDVPTGAFWTLRLYPDA